MKLLLDKVKKDFSNIYFTASDKFSWSPESEAIYYDSNQKNADWSLLHEIGHVLCNHQKYKYDFTLLKMEVEAWQKAEEIATQYGINIDQEHIQKCLDTYREWIYKRSTCPECTQAGLEKQSGMYTCINCGKTWRVSSEKFCRVYRKTVTA